MKQFGRQERRMDYRNVIELWRGIKCVFLQLYLFEIQLIEYNDEGREGKEIILKMDYGF